MEDNKLESIEGEHRRVSLWSRRNDKRQKKSATSGLQEGKSLRNVMSSKLWSWQWWYYLENDKRWQLRESKSSGEPEVESRNRGGAESCLLSAEWILPGGKYWRRDARMISGMSLELCLFKSGRREESENKWNIISSDWLEGGRNLLECLDRHLVDHQDKWLRIRACMPSCFDN